MNAEYFGAGVSSTDAVFTASTALRQMEVAPSQVRLQLVRAGVFSAVVQLKHEGL